MKGRKEWVRKGQYGQRLGMEPEWQGKRNVLQSMSEWGEWDAHPVVELRTRSARNRVIRSGGDVRGVASFHEAGEVGVHQNWCRQSTGRATRSSRKLLSRVETRRQDGSMARFDCDSDTNKTEVEAGQKDRAGRRKHMRTAHKVDVRDSGSSTRLALRSHENNDRLGVEARHSISVRILAPTKRH